MTKTGSPQPPKNCQASGRPRRSHCCGLSNNLKTTGLCLLLPWILVQAQLVASSSPVTPTPETLEGTVTLPTHTGRNQTSDGVQAAGNQINSGVQAAWNQTNSEVQAVRNQTNSGVQAARNQINSGVQAAWNQTNSEVQAARNQTNSEVQAARNQTNSEVQAARNQINSGVQVGQGPTDNEVQLSQEEVDDESWLTGSGQLSEGISHLGFSLLRKISLKHDNNVAFSPLGLALGLAALTLGSKGQTREELEKGLGLQDLTRPGHLPRLFRQLRGTLALNQELGLTQGSFAFIHKDFDIQESFLNVSRRYLDTVCVPVDFHNTSLARALMNYYVNKGTQGKIPRFFDEINPGTKLILADYILLRGKWRSPFDPEVTEVDTFHLDKYRAVKVPMMFQAGKFASTFDKTFRCHVLQLPYRGNASMLVVLMENMGDHLALEDYLSPELVDKWLKSLKTRNLEVFLPKFKLEQKYEMQQLLKQLGVRHVFSHRADLSELSATAIDLRVSKVLQRTVIQVDEKGTDAAAATLSEITAYSMPPVIKVNRPFHFLIYEETSRTLLFLGRVMDPSML